VGERKKGKGWERRGKDRKGRFRKGKESRVLPVLNTDY